MKPYHEQLDQIIDHAIDHVRTISDPIFNHKPSASKWSKKEILGHLIDSAYNNHQRFLRAAAQDNLIFQGYDQYDWVKKNNYHYRHREQVLNTWIIVNQHLSILIKGLSAEVLLKETRKHNFHQICMNRIQEGTKASLSYLVWDYIFHLEHHLSQIIPVYQRVLGDYKDGKS